MRRRHAASHAPAACERGADEPGRGAFYVIAIVIGMALLVGLLKRNRLAWQWGRIVGVLGAVLGTLVAGLSILGIAMAMQTGALDEVDVQVGGRSALIAGMALGVSFIAAPALCLWTVFFALGRPSARWYYRLVCPSCESRRVRAVGFFFNKARRRRCQAVW